MNLTAIDPGQHAILVLYPGTRETLSLSAYSQVLYGQVVNVDTGQDLIDLIDNSSNFHDLQFSNATQFYRWGLPAGVNAVEPGNWARLYLDPASGLIWRLDLAEAAPNKTDIVREYDPERQILMTDGGSYQVTDRTIVTKEWFSCYS